MSLHLTFSQSSPALWQSPILIAAVLTFTGVLLTVIIGTIANFRLAKRRSEFDRELATQKLEDERQARAEARATNLRLRRIEFQRATLVELQECLLELIRNYGLHLRNPDNNDIHDEKVRAGNGRSGLLISRLDNRDIAEEADEIKRTLNGDVTGSAAERQIDHNEAALLYVKFVKRVGEEIRRLDRDEETEASA